MGRNAWGQDVQRHDDVDLAIGETILRVERGAEVCVQVVDAIQGSASPVEDPIIVIRLSKDGRTLWINNQLSEWLDADVFVWLGRGNRDPAPSCPVAPHTVVELGFDDAVENASVSHFRFRSVAPGEVPDPDCDPR